MTTPGEALVQQALSNIPNDDGDTNYTQIFRDFAAAVRAQVAEEDYGFREALVETAVSLAGLMNQLMALCDDAETRHPPMVHAQAIRNALAAGSVVPAEPADEWQCPNCGHTIRARMVDASPRDT